MGTSQSSPGPGGKSPLVPSWADDQPGIPLPKPEARRFAPFRETLGRYLQSGNRDDLRSSLGNYARKGSGGGSTASRRMGSVNQAGASLYGALSGGEAFGVSEEKLVSLSDLSGQPCDAAIAQITDALTPEDGDADKIRSAMNHALVEALDGVEVFDPECITDDVIVNTMIGYLAESVFIQIVMDAGDAWNKAEKESQSISAENDLRELIKVVVDHHMASKFGGNVRSFTSQQIVKLERLVIQEVWSEWEDYQ